MFFDMIALRRLLALILVASPALWAAPSHSDDFDILKGKEIRAIIGGKPGAGTDVMGRSFLAGLRRVLPETTIHIQTISGGAGAAAVKERMTRDVPTFDTTQRLVRYGEMVRAKFNAWYDHVDAAAFEATIEADVGPRTLMQVLERTRLHSSFHLRQVYAFLEAGKVTPESPLTLEDMRGMGLEDLPDDIDIRPPGMD